MECQLGSLQVGQLWKLWLVATDIHAFTRILIMLSTWPQAGQQTRNIIADDKKNIPIHLVFYHFHWVSWTPNFNRMLCECILVYMNQSLYEFATQFRFIIVARSTGSAFASGNEKWNASQNVDQGPRYFPIRGHMWSLYKSLILHYVLYNFVTLFDFILFPQQFKGRPR